tara:strand:- start:655 stop:1029 length:375 start_codon:yes stop_codon:yes gene_type:complete
MKRKANGTDKNKLQREHKVYNKEMRQMGMHFLQKTFDEYVAYKYGKYKPKKRKAPTPEEQPLYRREESNVPSMNTLGQHYNNKNTSNSKIYTGKVIKGIGTMHKSNSVPVINSNVAKDLASMRR